MAGKDREVHYVYLGRSPTKKIKGVTFRPGVVTPVWDHKTHALIARLPYVREATPEEIKAGFAATKFAEAPREPTPEVEAKPAPKKSKKAPVQEAAEEPVPVDADSRLEIDFYRSLLKESSIGYDESWGVAELRAQYEAATGEKLDA